MRTPITEYKSLGGSFTGTLIVDPRQKQDLKDAEEAPDCELARHIRDTVEAVLSGIILLGTEEQLRLAIRGASQLVIARTFTIESKTAT